MVSPFSILTICRANIACSHIAERLLTAELESAGIHNDTVTVFSRGTHVDNSLDVPGEIGDLIAECGGDPRSHRPTQLTTSDLEAADLALVAEEATYNDVFYLLPVVSPHTFTMIQFAGLTSDIDWDTLAPVTRVSEASPRPTRLRESIDRIDRYRGYLPPDDISADIPDPAGHSLEVLTSTAKTIHRHTQTIAGWCAA
jgi:protein-tyrosine-phosphatase